MEKKLNPKKISEFTGYKPNKWQKIVESIDARFKLISAGRRTGKTKYVIEDPIDGLVPDLLKPDQYIWIVAPFYDLTQRVWMPLVKYARGEFSPIIKRIWDTKGAYKIETKYGTVIEAKSGENPERLVGVELDKIVIDEVAKLKKKAWFESLRPTLIGTKQKRVGKAIFIGTPKGKNWFYDLWLNDAYPINTPFGLDGKGKLELTEKQKAEREWASFRFTSYDNDYLITEELEKLVKDMPDFEYRQEVLASFEETAEQVFRKIGSNVYGKYREIPYDKEHLYSMGIDLGRKTSYTVIFVIDRMTHRVVYFDRFKTVDWKLQKERIKDVYKKYHGPAGFVDCTGIGDPMIEQLKDEGVYMEGFQFTEKSKKQLIDKLSIFIQEHRISYPDIPILLKEMERFGRKITDSGRIIYQSFGRMTSDCIMALALTVWDLDDEPLKRKTEEAITYPTQEF
jgi:hypothetical protein